MTLNISEKVSQSNDNPLDVRNKEVVYPVFDNPQVGNLATPINSSDFAKTFINNLPAYRRGLSSMRRGLEVGMAHGYWLIGPFDLFGPLRHTEVRHLAALLSVIGIITLSTIAISLYSSTLEQPTATVTAPDVPETFKTQEGWSEYAGGFFIGGMGGALFAYLLLDFVINVNFLGNLL